MLVSSACLQMMFVGLRLSLNVKEQNNDFLYGD